MIALLWPDGFDPVVVVSSSDQNPGGGQVPECLPSLLPIPPGIPLIRLQVEHGNA